MPRLSLTDLVDVVSTSGTPKATKVAQIKARPDYEPQFDFYKPLREAIQELHRTGGNRKTLDDVLSTLSDGNKLKNYPAAIKGYRKWLGSKSPGWFEPPRAEYSQGDVNVVVNPELGLDISGIRHLVKLYFKAQTLSKVKADLVTCVMEEALRPLAQPSDIMSLVDVRAGKLFRGGGADGKLRAIVDAELAYIASLWPKV